MSDFIEKTDYSTAIKEYVLDAITEAEDAVIDSAELRAISFMSGYLNIRFDVESIFAKRGLDRQATIVMFCTDITLFYIHQRHNPRKIPEFRKDAYKRAVEWLKEVRDGDIDPLGLDLKEGGENNTVVEIRSNPKRANHI